jgi:putative transposase
MARIDYWHKKLPGMGSRKMVVKLREDGVSVGRKLVRRYMTEMNIDCFSRKIVGWNLSDTLDTSPVQETVQEAVNNYGTPGILNSDQGSQFTSTAYKQLLASLNIRQSMDEKERWMDNRWIERWFRSLKTELIYISEFRSPRELRASIRVYYPSVQYRASAPVSELCRTG